MIDKKVIFTILLVNFLLYIAFGIGFINFSIILKNNGVGEFLMGVSFVVEALAGVAIAPFLNRLCGKIAAPKLLFFTTLLYCAVILVAPFYQNYFLWLLLMIPMGISWFGYITISSSIYNQNIGSGKRSLMFSLFTFFMVIGMSIGGFVIKAIGSDNHLIFIISAILALCSGLMILRLRNIKVHLQEGKSGNFLFYFKQRPQLFFSKFFQEYVSMTFFIFMVAFGIKNGFGPENAALIVSFYTLSGFLHILIGFLCDKISRVKMINSALFCSAAMLGLIYLNSGNYYLILAFAFVAGICAATMAIAIGSEINNFFPKADLVSANGYLGMIANYGGIAASLITGFLLQFVGNFGIALPVLVMAVGILIFKIVRKFG
jgi:MFS family permease